MESGIINNNTANGTGGGGVKVSSGGSFNMSGDAKISGNTANMYGGGVEVSEGSFDMSGGAEISGNIANQSGGGVYVGGCISASFTMSGGTISGNIADDTTGYGTGGGVYVAGATTVFDKTGGIIYGGPGGPPNNTALGGSTKGHAVYSNITPASYRDIDLSAADDISVDNGVYAGPWGI
jgi:hypothetical protein